MTEGLVRAGTLALQAASPIPKMTRWIDNTAVKRKAEKLVAEVRLIAAHVDPRLDRGLERWMREHLLRVIREGS